MEKIKGKTEDQISKLEEIKKIISDILKLRKREEGEEESLEKYKDIVNAIDPVINYLRLNNDSSKRSLAFNQLISEGEEKWRMFIEQFKDSNGHEQSYPGDIDDTNTFVYVLKNVESGKIDSSEKELIDNFIESYKEFHSQMIKEVNVIKNERFILVERTEREENN